MPIALAFAVLLAAPEVQRAIDPGQLEHRPSLIDAVKLRRSHADAHGTPAQRDHFLREHRRWLADRLAGLCASGDESACADALLALADLERFELSIAEPAPFETRPCPASLDHAGCASRVLAPGYRILLGPLVFEFIAGERGELQLLAGRFAEQGESIALLREQSLASPALAECARRAAALPPLDIQFEEDPNIDPELLRSFDRVLETNSSLEGKSPAVLCMDESHGRFHLLAHEQPAAASENSDGWLVRRHRYDTPCRGLGWMLTSFPGRSPRPITRWALSRKPIPAQGKRVQRFGQVTLLEERVVKPWLLPRCTLTRGDTRYEQLPCEAVFAGDVNGDGIADFIFESDGNDCDSTTLILSNPTGWSASLVMDACE